MQVSYQESFEQNFYLFFSEKKNIFIVINFQVFRLLNVSLVAELCSRADKSSQVLLDKGFITSNKKI